MNAHKIDRVNDEFVDVFSGQRCFTGKLSPQSSDISGGEDEAIKKSGSCDEGSESRDNSGDDHHHHHIHHIQGNALPQNGRKSLGSKFSSSAVAGGGKSTPAPLPTDNIDGLYSCDQCDKSFSKPSSLTRHKYEHSGNNHLSSIPSTTSA